MPCWLKMLMLSKFSIIDIQNKSSIRWWNHWFLKLGYFPIFHYHYFQSQKLSMARSWKSTARCSRPSALHNLLLRSMISPVSEDTEWLLCKAGNEMYWKLNLITTYILILLFQSQHKSTHWITCGKWFGLPNSPACKWAFRSNLCECAGTRCRRSSFSDKQVRGWWCSCTLCRCTSRFRCRRKQRKSSSRSRCRCIWRVGVCCSRRSECYSNILLMQMNCSSMDLLLWSKSSFKEMFD